MLKLMKIFAFRMKLENGSLVSFFVRCPQSIIMLG